MSHEGQANRRKWHRILLVTEIVGLGLLGSCAVYDPSLSEGGSGARGGGASGTSQVTDGGSEAEAGRGGAALGAAGGAGSFGVMYPGGTDAGGADVAGSVDGGAAGEAGGESSGGKGGQAGASGSASGGGSGGTLSSGGSTGGTGGSPPSIKELSLKKPATASGQQTGKEVAKGNDGDGATRWCAKDGTFPQWWRVDLGATHSLKEFKISFEYSDRKYSYDIETSTDDATYILQARTSGTAALQTGLFPAGVSARYVRITITNAEAGAYPTWASFFEFVVTGS